MKVFVNFKTDLHVMGKEHEAVISISESRLKKEGVQYEEVSTQVNLRQTERLNATWQDATYGQLKKVPAGSG